MGFNMKQENLHCAKKKYKLNINLFIANFDF